MDTKRLILNLHHKTAYQVLEIIIKQCGKTAVYFAVEEIHPGDDKYPPVSLFPKPIIEENENDD